MENAGWQTLDGKRWMAKIKMAQITGKQSENDKLIKNDIKCSLKLHQFEGAPVKWLKTCRSFVSLVDYHCQW